jgi:uncharacterized membrane protein HdeD (DUF308 family)
MDNVKIGSLFIFFGWIFALLGLTETMRAGYYRWFEQYCFGIILLSAGFCIMIAGYFIGKKKETP